MKSAQFFQTVVFTGANVVAVQEGSKGYKLVAQLEKADKETGEVSINEVTMETVDNEPRYFKSVASIPEILRDKEIYSFTVKIADSDIKKSKRAKKPATPAKTAAKGKETATA